MTENEERMLAMIETLTGLVGQLTAKIGTMDVRLRCVEKWAAVVAKDISKWDTTS